MPTLLTKIRTAPDQQKVVKYDVGRTLGLTILGAICLIGAIVLWAVHDNVPAQIVFSLGEAIVAGGFGVAVGEKRGALSAGAQPDGG